MNINFGPSVLTLPLEGVVALHDAKGARVECLQGAVWITEEGETRDVVLDEQSDATILHDGLTLLMALQPASVRVTEATQPDATLFDRIFAAPPNSQQSGRPEFAATMYR